MSVSDLLGEFFYDVDVKFMIKFVLIFLILVILPVWKWNIADISLLYKFLFTIGGGAGAWFALQGKSMKGLSSLRKR